MEHVQKREMLERQREGWEGWERGTKIEHSHRMGEHNQPEHG